MSQQSSGQGIKGKGKNINTVTYVMLFMALGAMTFFGVCSPQAYQDGLVGDAGHVKGESISNKEFVRAYESHSEQLKRQYGEDYNASALRVANSVLDRLIDDRILYLEAKELGLQATDEEVVEYFDKLEFLKDKDGNFSEETFRNFLRRSQYTESALQEEVRRIISVQRLRDLINQTTFASSKAVEMDYKIAESKINVEYIKVSSDQLDMEISAEEKAEFLKQEAAQERIKAWYESHKSDYSKKEKVKARHILVGFKGSRNASSTAAKRSKADAEKRAKSLLAQVTASGANFTEIAKKETDDPSGKSNGGDLGFFTRDAMVKEFSDAAFSLAEGSISDLIESPFGYHIIKVEGKQEASETSLDDAKDSIIEKFISQDKGPKLAEQRAQNLLDALNKNESIDESLQKYGLKWEKTGDLSYTTGYIPGLGTQQDVKDAVFSLTKEKPLHDKVFKSGQNYFVLKLSEFKEADMSKLNDLKREQLAASSNFSMGYGMFLSFQKNVKEKYEKSRDIYKNPAYLAIDNPRDQE